MKRSIKINEIIILSIVLAFLSTTVIFAQTVKPSPKTKAKTTKAQPKTVLTPTQNGPKAQVEIPAQAVEFFKKGQAHWKNLDIQDAIDAYTEAIKIYPNYMAALGERGTINFMIAKPELALPDFEAVLKLEPKNAKFLNYRGLTFTEIALKIKETEIFNKPAADNAQKALADFNSAIEIEPKNSSYYNSRGKLLLEFEFYHEAIVDFEKAILLEPKNEYAYTYLGYAKFVTEKGNGIEEIDKAISLNPSFGEAFYLRGQVDRMAGRYEEAISDFDRAIEISKYNAKYYNARGMLHFRQQDGYAAVKDFSKAIDEKRDYGTAYFNRAMTYKKFPYSVSTDPNHNAIDKMRLQRQKMMEDLNMAIKYKPNFDDAYVERGLINSTDMRNSSSKLDAETISRLNLGLADFEQAIKINPKNAEAYNGRASCNDDLGKKDLALADYTKAIELDPELATAYMGRMGIYCEMGKKELSIADETKIKALARLCPFLLKSSCKTERICQSFQK